MVGMRLEPGMSSPNRIDLRLPNCREGCSLPATSVPTPAVAWPIATSQQEELHPTPGVEGAAIDILVPFTNPLIITARRVILLGGGRLVRPGTRHPRSFATIRLSANPPRLLVLGLVRDSRCPVARRWQIVMEVDTRPPDPAVDRRL